MKKLLHLQRENNSLSIKLKGVAGGEHTHLFQVAEAQKAAMDQNIPAAPAPAEWEQQKVALEAELAEREAANQRQQRDLEQLQQEMRRAGESLDGLAGRADPAAVQREVESLKAEHVASMESLKAELHSQQAELHSVGQQLTAAAHRADQLQLGHSAAAAAAAAVSAPAAAKADADVEWRAKCDALRRRAEEAQEQVAAQAAAHAEKARAHVAALAGGHAEVRALERLLQDATLETSGMSVDGTPRAPGVHNGFAGADAEETALRQRLAEAERRAAEATEQTAEATQAAEQAARAAAGARAKALVEQAAGLAHHAGEMEKQVRRALFAPAHRALTRLQCNAARGGLAGAPAAGDGGAPPRGGAGGGRGGGAGGGGERG